MEFRTALQILRTKGHKLTPQRMEILRVLVSANAAISAHAVLERVRAVYPCISLDTVYRNLAMLTSTGMVNQINLQTKGTALFEFQGEAHHHHAICLHCGKSFCMNFCPLPAQISLPPADPDFLVVNHAFEVYGYCSVCHAQALSG